MVLHLGIVHAQIPSRKAIVMITNMGITCPIYSIIIISYY